MASPESAISEREVIEAITELRGDIKRVESKIDAFSDPCDLASEAYAIVRQIQHEQSAFETQLDTMWWTGSVIFVAVVGLIIQSLGKKNTRKDG
jgi:hypothetical protein